MFSPAPVVTKKAEFSVSEGHPWIYDTEVLSVSEGFVNGGLVDAVTEKGRYLGTGFLSTESKIRIRLISRNANDRFDRDFFRRRIQYAWDYRRPSWERIRTVAGSSSARRISSRAHGGPPFHDILVTQTLSVGIEKLKPMLFPLISTFLTENGELISGLYERNDVAIRQLEGLEENKGWFPLPGVANRRRRPPSSTKTYPYLVDFENGQKTGFFLDQKYNRLAVSKLAKGRRVLDCFTHTGSFALNAAKGGASYVKAADISESALESGKAQRGTKRAFGPHRFCRGGCVRSSAVARKLGGKI
jgi:23S rRNA (cytosine1962-C5)-methyltransferase